MGKPPPTRSPRVYLGFIALVCVLFATPLLGFTATGTYMRPTGDDYCYGGVVTRHGLWKAQIYSYTNAVPYRGGRFALSLTSGFLSILPPKTTGLLTGLAILLWVIGLVTALRSSKGPGRLVPLEALALAEVLIFFTLSFAPDLVQSLYWRSGMLTYLAPLILFPYLLALLAAGTERTRPTVAHAVVLFTLAFFAAGFSETASAMQLGLLLLVLAVAVCKHRSAPGKKPQAAVLTLIAIVATVAAILVLFVSPSSQLWLPHLPPPPDIITLAREILTSAYIFLHGTAKRLFLPHFAVFILLCIMSLHAGWRQPPPGRFNVGRTMAALLGLLLSSVFVLAFIMAPSAWAQSSYPDLRALIGARFVSVLAAGIAGFLIGKDLARITTGTRLVRTVSGATAVLVLAISAYFPYLSLRQTVAEWPRYAKWALFWDQRDRAIRDARNQGNMDIEVVEIDHIVPNVGELQPDDNFWYNNCAEDYYDVRNLRADLPGWDD